MLTYLFAYLFLVTAKSHTNQLGLLRRRHPGWPEASC